ncbi:MAG: hypothetical protein IKR27_05510, partial [Lachnospiraceae bacterium]|nr:hypothetical protein [Lachnospiraceae bacterium]
MKKKRLIMLLLVLVFAMTAFIACGKVKAPTEKDIKEALIEEGILKEETESDEDESKSSKKSDESEDEDESSEASESVEKEEEKGYHYEIKIDDSKIRNKEKATVYVSFIEKNNGIEITTPLVFDFKYNKDKKKWRYRGVSFNDDEEVVPEIKVSGSADEQTIKKALEYQDFRVGDYYISASDIKSMKIAESELDKKTMNQLVKLEIEAQDRSMIHDYSFTAELELGVNGLSELAKTYKKYVKQFESADDTEGLVATYWRYINYDILNNSSWRVLKAEVDENSVKSEYTEHYKSLSAKEDDVKSIIKSTDNSMYVLGKRYSTGSDNVEVKNVTVGDAVYGENERASIPIKYELLFDGKITASYEGSLTYNYYDKTWNPGSYISDNNMTGLKGDYTGKWAGTYNDRHDKMTMEITDKVNDDKYPVVNIEIDALKDKGKYSWTGYLAEFDTETGDGKIYFKEWVNKPEDGDEYAYFAIKGNLLADELVSEDRYNDYVLKKGASADDIEVTTKDKYTGNFTAYVAMYGDKEEEGDNGYLYLEPGSESNKGGVKSTTDNYVKVGKTITLTLTVPESP